MRRRRLSFVVRIWIRSEEEGLWTGQVAEFPDEKRHRTVNRLEDITEFVGQVLDEWLAAARQDPNPETGS